MPTEARETGTDSTTSKPLELSNRMSSTGSTDDLSASSISFNHGPAASRPQPSPSFMSVEPNDERVSLLNIFRADLATWMDVFDFEKTYEREITSRALYSDFLLRCICAFTARHLSLLESGNMWFPVASHYYGEVRSSSCHYDPFPTSAWVDIFRH